MAWSGLSLAAATNDLTVSYEPYHFAPGEGWHVTSAGKAGATKLEGRTWTLDFTQGAPWIGLSLPDRSLMTRPERFRLRVRGGAPGHPVEVFLHTHFMTFHKVVGSLTGHGEQELAFAAPPGPGWQWFGGENDGKIHGPLRLGEIRLEAGGRADQARLELLSCVVEGQCPADKLCALTADEASTPHGETFHAQARSLASRPLDATLHWVVRDWEQRERLRGHCALRLPAHGQPVTVEVPLPALPKAFHFAEAEFGLELPGQSVAPARAYWLAPVPARPQAALDPQSPFGMGVYLCRYSPESMEEVARKARAAGVKWSREDFNWDRIEPHPGEFHWEYYDRLLECATRNGITVYAIVGYWTSWSKAYTAEGISQYVAFLRQLVRHYHGRIQQWEIWNEPNIFFWQGPKELYADLLKASYTAVKEEDPTAQVLGLSTAGTDFRFIEKMLKLEAPFDILTIHPYRRQLDDQAFINDLKKASDLVRLPNGTRRPVWLTELGWATHIPHPVLKQDFEPVSPRVQAELIVRAYLCSIGSGVEPRTFWYDFRNDGTDPFYFEHNMGILGQDGRPKPAYLTYATLSRLLEGARLVGPMEAGPGNFAYRFAGAGARQVIAVWNPHTDATAELKLLANRIRVVNAVGEVSEPGTPVGGGGRRVTHLDLRAGVPVYVEINGAGH